MLRRSGSPSRGAALILVAAALALIAFLALAFARSMSLERDAARSEVDRVQAVFACEAAIQHGVARLRADLRTELVSGPSSAWYYHPLPDGRFPPLHESADPSYEISTTGYSGELEIDRGRRARYKLRIADTSALVWVNDPDPGLGRVLGDLAELLGLGRDVGDRVVRGRDRGPYHSPEDLLARGVLGPDEYGLLSGHLTCQGVASPDTVRAVRHPATGRTRFEKHPKALVNVNTASVHVLAALLVGLSAEREADWVEGGKLVAEPISAPQALALARAVDQRRTRAPFRTRAELDRFLANEGRAIAGLSGLQASCVLVAWNPAPDSARLNADLAHHRPFDLGDLAFDPRPVGLHGSGTYGIEALAEVLDPTGENPARARLSSLVRLGRVDSISDQQQLEARRAGSRGTATRPEPIFTPAPQRKPTIDRVRLFALAHTCWPHKGDYIRFGIGDVRIDEEPVDVCRDWDQTVVDPLPFNQVFILSFVEESSWERTLLDYMDTSGRTRHSRAEDGVRWFDATEVPAAGEDQATAGLVLDLPVEDMPRRFTFTIHDLERKPAEYARGYGIVYLACYSGERLIGYYYAAFYYHRGDERDRESRSSDAAGRDRVGAFYYGTGTFGVELDLVRSMPPAIREFLDSEPADWQGAIDPPEGAPEPSRVAGAIGLGRDPLGERCREAAFYAHQTGDLRHAHACHSDEAMRSPSARPGETAVASVFEDGDRLVDGAYFSRQRRRVRSYRSASHADLAAKANLPPIEGYVEFWYKPDDERSGSVLFHGFNPSDDTGRRGIQTYVVDDGSELRVVRFLFEDVAPPVAPVASIPLAGTDFGDRFARRPDPLLDAARFAGPRSSDDELPPGWRAAYVEVAKRVELVPHRWHHVEFWWKEYTDCWLRVDGDDRPDRKGHSVAGRFHTASCPANDFGVGPGWSDRDRAADVWPSGTFDGLRIRRTVDDERLADAEDDRFEADDDLDAPRAYYDLDVPVDLSGGAEPLWIAWTEREPDGSAVDVQLRSGAVLRLLAPRDGSGTRWPQEPRGEGIVPLRVVFTRDPARPLRLTPLFEDLSIFSLVRTEFLEWRIVLAAEGAFDVSRAGPAGGTGAGRDEPRIPDARGGVEQPTAGLFDPESPRGGISRGPSSSSAPGAGSYPGGRGSGDGLPAGEPGSEAAAGGTRSGLVSLASSVASREKGRTSVHVIVLDGRGGAVPDADVRIEDARGTVLSRRTDARGAADFDEVPAGRCRLEVAIGPRWLPAREEVVARGRPNRFLVRDR